LHTIGTSQKLRDWYLGSCGSREFWKTRCLGWLLFSRKDRQLKWQFSKISWGHPCHWLTRSSGTGFLAPIGSESIHRCEGKKYGCRMRASITLLLFFLFFFPRVFAISASSLAVVSGYSRVPWWIISSRIPENLSKLKRMRVVNDRDARLAYCKFNHLRTFSI